MMYELEALGSRKPAPVHFKHFLLFLSFPDFLAFPHWKHFLFSVSAIGQTTQQFSVANKNADIFAVMAKDP